MTWKENKSHLKMYTSDAPLSAECKCRDEKAGSNMFLEINALESVCIHSCSFNIERLNRWK